MTRAEFILLMRGFARKQSKEWQHTRLTAYTTASTIRSKKRLPHIKTWMPLAIDKEGKPDLSVDEMLEQWQLLKNESNIKSTD